MPLLGDHSSPFDKVGLEHPKAGKDEGPEYELPPKKDPVPLRVHRHLPKSTIPNGGHYVVGTPARNIGVVTLNCSPCTCLFLW